MKPKHNAMLVNKSQLYVLYMLYKYSYLNFIIEINDKISINVDSYVHV